MSQHYGPTWRHEVQQRELMAAMTGISVSLRQADYSLSEEQEAVQSSFGALLARASPIEKVRAAEPFGFDAELWEQLNEMRAIAMAVPEASGGDGADLVALCVVAEQIGRYLAPAPFVEAVSAARLLARAGSAAAAELEAVLSGRAMVTLALHPVTSAADQLVPAGAIADHVVALVDDQLVCAPRTEGWDRADNHGRTPLARLPAVAFENAKVIQSGEDARLTFAQGIAEWKLLTGAALIGIGEGANSIGVEYAKVRSAFGSPIGAFQAVSHQLVDAAMAVAAGRRLLFKAAWFAEHEAHAGRHLIPMAYLHAERASLLAATVAVHVLGGVGFTVDGDAQLFFRRAKGWSLVGGDPNREIHLIADLLFGPATR